MVRNREGAVVGGGVAFIAPPRQQSAAMAFSPQQVHDNPFGYSFSPMTSPVVCAGGSCGNDCAMIANVPFAPPPYMPGTADCQAVVPSLAVNDDPFGVFGGNALALASTPASDDPFGVGVLGGSSLALAATTSLMSNDLDDPFGGMFGAPAPASTAAASTPASAGDGFATTFSSSRALIDQRLEHLPKEKPIELDSNGVPSEKGVAWNNGDGVSFDRFSCFFFERNCSFSSS